MRNVFVAGILAVLCTGGAMATQQNAAPKVADNISCRFTGLERAYANEPEIKLELRLPAAAGVDPAKHRDATFSSRAAKRHTLATRDTPIPIENSEATDLGNILSDLEQNGKQLDSGRHYLPRGFALKMLEVDRPLYARLREVRSIVMYTFNNSETWNGSLDGVFLLYKEDGSLMTIYGFGNNTDIYSFCIPEQK